MISFNKINLQFILILNILLQSIQCIEIPVNEIR